MYTALCTYRTGWAAGAQTMYTGRYPTGVPWSHDGVGEGPHGPPPRPGRPRAHPRRVPAAVPRAGHQPHRHGPALRGGRGVQAHGLPALRRQGRTSRRVPAPVRPLRSVRCVRPHRPHAPRTAPRRLRHPPTTPLCPYIGAAVELHDPQHPASQYARDYKRAVAARLADAAREAGAADPEQLGEQLALLLDGAAARTRVLNADAFPTAAAIAAVLIDNAIPATAGDDRRREEAPS